MKVKKMKLAILTPTFHKYSGIDRVVEMDAKRFAEDGYEVTIFALKASMWNKNIITYNNQYATVVELGIPKNPTLERIYRLLFFLDRKKIKNTAKMLKDYDIIISHLYPMTLISSYAKKKYDIPFSCVFHGYTPHNNFDGFKEKIYMKIMNYLIFKSMKNADYIVSDSAFVAASLYEKTGQESFVKHIKINEDIYNKDVKVFPYMKKEYENNKPILLYVGRLSPHKGIHLLLDAFKIIQTKYPDAALIIAGKPTFDKYFEKLTKQASKNVHFVINADDNELSSYYALCDVYVTCSLWEGYDMPIVEANACGKPAVAFDIGAHKEVIDKNGILIKEGDIDEFAKGVINVLDKNKS